MEGGVATGEDSTMAATSSSAAAVAAVASSSPTSRALAASQAQTMEAPTGLHKLRGPSPIVWAMRTRVAPPPQLAEPIPRPVYPPPPPPQAPLPPMPERRRRGRPRKCESLPPPPGFAPLPAARPPTPAAPAQGKGKLDGLQPHVLTIAAGEDIISRVMSVSLLHSKAICVLSALGSVKEAFLLQPSGVILNHKGPLEIIRLSGSILTPNDHRCLRVTLATVNSFVISGIIAGPLIAETPVQAILGSFHNASFWPNNPPRAAVACYPNAQGTVGNGSTHQGSAPCTPVQQNGSSEIDVKPTLAVLNTEYAAWTPGEHNGPSEIDIKPSLGVNNLIGGISTSQGGTEVHGLTLGVNNSVNGISTPQGGTEVHGLTLEVDKSIGSISTSQGGTEVHGLTLGVNNSIGSISTSQGGTEVHGLTLGFNNSVDAGISTSQGGTEEVHGLDS